MASLLYVLEIKLKALPEVRAVASFVARLNIISQTLTLPNEETQSRVIAWSFFILTQCNQDIEDTSFWLPFNFCKARYVSF